MATSYPSGIDNFTNPSASDALNSATVPHATQHANANDAIEAIETELGTNPKGAKATVKARLDDVDTAISGKVATTTTISTTAPIAGGGDLSANRTLTVSAASTSASGVVQLSDSTSTTSSVLASTPTATKAAYDAAVASVQPARSISTTAPIAGGGDLSANRTLSLNIGSSLTTSSSNLVVDSTVVPYLAAANTFTTSPQQINAAASAKGLIIKGAASQTANLQEWQDSASTVLSFVDSAGRGKFLVGLFGTFTTSVGASIGVATNLPTTIGLLVRGIASQTTDLVQYQNSAGTILSGFNAAGQLYAGTTASVVGSTTTALTSAAYTSATVAVFTYGGTSLVQVGQRVTVAGVTGGTYNGTWTVSAVTSTTFTVLGSGFTNVAGTGGTFQLSAVGSFVAGTAAITPLVVQAAASQTVNLQEWQNSAGTIVARVSSAGNINGTGITANAGTGVNADFFVDRASSGSYFNMTSTNIILQTRTATNIGLIVKGATSQTGDLQQWASSSATLTAITSAGTINFASGNTSATATAGAVTAPALVVGFITMQVAGTTVKIPYYAN